MGYQRLKVPSGRFPPVAVFNLRPDLVSGVSRRIRQVLRKVMEGEGIRSGRLTVVLADDAWLGRLNRDYLGENQPTDVLAFDLSAGEGVEGDIYVNAEEALRRFPDDGEAARVEVLSLAAHGMLHLCGYDHDDEAGYRLMLSRGDEYLKAAWG